MLSSCKNNDFLRGFVFFAFLNFFLMTEYPQRIADFFVLFSHCM